LVHRTTLVTVLDNHSLATDVRH